MASYKPKSTRQKSEIKIVSKTDVDVKTKGRSKATTAKSKKTDETTKKSALASTERKRKSASPELTASKPAPKAKGAKTVKKKADSAVKSRNRSTSASRSRTAKAESSPQKKSVRNKGKVGRPDALDRILTSETLLENYAIYAREVDINRAIPGIDGMKPVHRSILWTMYEERFTSFKKSARVVGSVIGKYHPHGDQSTYGALAGLVPHFKNNVPLIDGQGSFGGLDGSNPAAMRYTEVRLGKLADLLLGDLKWEGVVPMVPNYDETLKMPKYLPAKINYLLVSGTGGVGVGIRNSIPSYAPLEVIEATQYVLNNAKSSDKKILDILAAPSFPIPSVIMEEDLPRIREAHETGQGNFPVYAPVTIHEKRANTFLVTGLPPETTTVKLMEDLAAHELVTSAVDESTDGVRIVVRCNKPAVEALPVLYRETALSKTVTVSMYVVSEESKLESVNLPTIVREFVRMRKGVVERRIRIQMSQLEKEIHQKEAVRKILADIDAFLNIVKNAANREAANKQLCKHFALDEAQASYLLSLQIGTITRQERHKIEELLKQLEKEKASLGMSLKNISQVVSQEQDEIREILKANLPKELVERRTVIRKGHPYVFGVF